MSARYRIVQLDGLDIYRIEERTKRWFRDEYRWKVKTFHRWGYDGCSDCFTEFDSATSVGAMLCRLQHIDREAQERARNNWHTVKVV